MTSNQNAAAPARATASRENGCTSYVGKSIKLERVVVKAALCLLVAGNIAAVAPVIAGVLHG